MMGTKNLFRIISLVGPKHSGKSSVGKELALMLNADFLDLDFYIEERTGKSPRVLYKEGIGFFRKAELESLREILERSKKHTSIIVLATGGGIIDNAEAAALLKEHTTTVYLETSYIVAWNRILETSRISGELPPFLQTDNPEKSHRELHERRSNEYREMAALTVNAEASPPDEIAHQIKQLLNC